MKKSQPQDFNLALQKAAKTAPFYRLPADWPDVIRVKSDDESGGTVWWRRTLYRDILRERSPSELSSAINWLEKKLPGTLVALRGTTRFRELLNLTSGGSLEIEGFPRVTDLELYALLAVLLVNERKLALQVAESSRTTDESWFAENKAQITEIFVVCWKLREAFMAGKEDGLVSSNKKGGKARYKDIAKYHVPVLDRFESGNRRGEWRDLLHAKAQIHNELKAKKEKNQPIPSELTIERWIRDHRQGKGFDLATDKTDVPLSIVYL
ncbi:hypothetical protein [Polaromonas sp.]|uniref:hypothetical protein n=1 Tax=Polaromonas sp. TaxID=1869339 RepID=UPI003BABE3F0